MSPVDLRQGVSEITAVEIDPAIIAIGQEFHPEQPYSSAAVNVVNDDARSFFASTRQKYDIISFSLLDSHTTTALTNARLDHYVYTKESIERARDLLSEHGIVVLTFAAQRIFIADRMANVLEEVFGEEPISFVIPGSPYGWGGVMFISGDLATARAQIAANPRLNSYIDNLRQAEPLNLPHTTRVTTDDWPYIYLESAKDTAVVLPALWDHAPGFMDQRAQVAGGQAGDVFPALALAFLFPGRRVPAPGGTERQ